MIGWEAWIAWDFFSGDREETGRLQEPAAEYITDWIGQMDARGLLDTLRQIMDRLHALKIPETAIREGLAPERVERMVITRDYRILLPDRYHAEIRMRPLVKTVFLLFLRHPEGIRFGDLGAYREEMLALYGGITGRGDRAEVERSIDRLIDPKDNSIHEKASNLSAALSRYFEASELGRYVLTGKPGAPKYIPLDRRYVEWE